MMKYGNFIEVYNNITYVSHVTMHNTMDDRLMTKLDTLQLLGE